MAKMSKMEMIKKRIGPASSRDKRITWSGIFGTSASRKAQEKRLAPPAATPKKKTGTVSEVGVTARKKATPTMNVPAKTKSAASRSSAPRKSSMDAGLAARKTLGGPGGLSEDNAVMKRLRQRAMERAVAKAKKK